MTPSTVRIERSTRAITGKIYEYDNYEVIIKGTFLVEIRAEYNVSDQDKDGSILEEDGYSLTALSYNGDEKIIDALSKAKKKYYTGIGEDSFGNSIGNSIEEAVWGFSRLILIDLHWIGMIKLEPFFVYPWNDGYDWSKETYFTGGVAPLVRKFYEDEIEINNKRKSFIRNILGK